MPPPNKRIDEKSQQAIETQFFLYTPKLNENATKNLRKAATNREERDVLASIFTKHRQTAEGSSEMSEKMEQILLDFHYINYEFCKDNQFSNEKISTFLAIMDFVLQHMLERQLLPEEGFKQLKRILERHSL